jgi:hypothetical protein
MLMSVKITSWSYQIVALALQNIQSVFILSRCVIKILIIIIIEIIIIILIIIIIIIKIIIIIIIIKAFTHS